MSVVLAEPPVKVVRTLTAICTCGQPISLDRAIAVTCPTCGSGPGLPCVDMRSKSRGKVPKSLTKVHPERVAALPI